MCDKVGIDTPKLQHGNKSSNHLSLDDIYTQELIDLVAEKENSVITLKSYDYPISINLLIDVPKTGATSINHLLLPLLGIEDIFSYPNFRLQKIQTEAKPTQDNIGHSTTVKLFQNF